MIKPVPKPWRDPSRPANEMTTTDGRTFAVTSFTLSAAGSSAAAPATIIALATIPNIWRDIDTRSRLRFCFGFGPLRFGFGFSLFRFDAQAGQRPLGDPLHILTGIGGCLSERADRGPRDWAELFESRHGLNTNRFLRVIQGGCEHGQCLVGLSEKSQGTRGGDS